LHDGFLPFVCLIPLVVQPTKEREFMSPLASLDAKDAVRTQDANKRKRFGHFNVPNLMEISFLYLA